MQYLLRWQAVPAGIQADLEDLVDQLDAKYFDAKDAAEAADEGDENWHRAFHEARASAAVLFRCNEDPVRAAAESAFEANAAAHDDTAARGKSSQRAYTGRAMDMFPSAWGMRAATEGEARVTSILLGQFHLGSRAKFEFARVSHRNPAERFRWREASGLASHTFSLSILTFAHQGAISIG